MHLSLAEERFAIEIKLAIENYISLETNQVKMKREKKQKRPIMLQV